MRQSNVLPRNEISLENSCIRHKRREQIKVLTYIVSPSSRKSIKLPLRFCDLSLAEPWVSSSAASARPAPSSSGEDAGLCSSCGCKKYVPTTKYWGCAGQKAMQLGGRSKVNDSSEERAAIVGQAHRAVFELFLPGTWLIQI